MLTYTDQPHPARGRQSRELRAHSRTRVRRRYQRLQALARALLRCSLYLLYWYKRALLVQQCFTGTKASKRWHALYSFSHFTCFTGTKVQMLQLCVSADPEGAREAGAHFTCFTGTKVQMLQLCVSADPEGAREAGAHFTCFTGTKVQMPTQKALQQAANCARTGSTLTAHADMR
jgi:hypothetical protein